jgi:hypothetical protein
MERSLRCVRMDIIFVYRGRMKYVYRLAFSFLNVLCASSCLDATVYFESGRNTFTCDFLQSAAGNCEPSIVVAKVKLNFRLFQRISGFFGFSAFASLLKHITWA